MARRGGKAASRRSRQRQAPRRPVIPPPQPKAQPVPPIGTPDAREAESLSPPRRTTPPTYAMQGSLLSDRERAEYHYVERDLRNIGILTAIMAVLLLVAWIAFSALGLVG